MALLNPPTSNLLELPAEIRFMIYGFLDLETIPIIVSEKRKYRWQGGERCIRRRREFLQILLVNKQLYEEVGCFFYANRKYLIGNGWYGSSSAPNLKGFKILVNCTPAHHLACITSMGFLVYFAEHNSYVSGPGDIFLLGSKADLSSFHTLARAIPKHFKGLRQIDIRFEKPEKHYYYVRDDDDTRDDCVEVAKALSHVIQCKNLELVTIEVSTWDVDITSSRFIDLLKVAKHFEKIVPELSKFSKTTTLSKFSAVYEIDNGSGYASQPFVLAPRQVYSAFQRLPRRVR